MPQRKTQSNARKRWKRLSAAANRVNLEKNNASVSQMTKLLISVLLISLSISMETFTSTEPPRVILIIGDGLDDQHVTMGRNYLVGMSGELNLDQMPFRASIQIETISSQGDPIYHADSANTATSIATGVLTSIGRVGTDINDQDIPTIAEQAIDEGIRVGLVTTSSLTDATPAAFLTHVSSRSCQGPKEIFGSSYLGLAQPACAQDARINGGLGSIAEQLVDSGAYVLLGGGAEFFLQKTSDDETVFQRGNRQGFQIATSLRDLNQALIDRPLLGVFGLSTLEVRWQGTDGRTAEPARKNWLNSISSYLGSVKQPEPIYCEPNPRYDQTPSLVKMTEKAIELLESSNNSGFFLMVESASIDKQSHARNPCGSIGEIEQLEEVLAFSNRFVELHPNTLIIVTADHSQAAQIIPEPSLDSNNLLPIYSPGRIARVITPERGVMRINYATTNSFSEQHTGANVPLFSNDAEGRWLRSYMRQREIYKSIRKFLFPTSASQVQP